MTDSPPQDEASSKEATDRILDRNPRSDDLRKVNDTIATGQASARHGSTAVSEKGLSVAAQRVSDSAFINVQPEGSLFQSLFAVHVHETEIGESAEVQFVPARSRLADSLEPLMRAFASAADPSVPRPDENLFIVGLLDGLYRVLFMHLPPDDVDDLPPTEVDDLVLRLRKRAALMAEYTSSSGFIKQLSQSWTLFQGVCDKYQEIMTQRRFLVEAREIALSQAQTDWKRKRLQEKQDRSGDVGEVFREVSDMLGDMNRLDRLVKLGFRERDRGLRQELDRFMDSAKAQTSTKLIHLAQSRGWPDGSWHFDKDEDLWDHVRRLQFEREFAPIPTLFNELLRRSPNDYMRSMFYIHSVVAGDSVSREAQVRLAASVTNRIPDASIYDIDRMTALVFVARNSLAILREEQGHLPFGDQDQAYAGHVHDIWNMWVECQPDFCPEESIDALTFTLAALGRLEEAYKVGLLGEAGGRTGLAYSMARISSRLGKPDESLEFLKSGLRLSGVIDVVACRHQADLCAVREQRSERFASLTSIRIKAALSCGAVWNTAILTNQSSFALHDFCVVILDELGRPYERTGQKLDINANCEVNVGPVQVKRYELKCHEGAWRAILS
jgi:hypothetical protein